MLLNAALIAESLPQRFDPVLSQINGTELTLGRPELYEGDPTQGFRSGHVYLLQAEQLPARARTERGALIVCIGKTLRLAFYQQRCDIITLAEDSDFFAAFNALQQLYNRYDAWEHDLAAIVDDDADIARMLSRSEEVFGNALYAIDASFHILGISRLASQFGSNDGPVSDGGTSLRLGAFDQYIGSNELMLDVKGPFHINVLGEETLNLNLFEHDEYQGCITVHYRNRPPQASDEQLIVILAQHLSHAMHRLARTNRTNRGSLRLAVQNLVEGLPLDAGARSVVEGENERHTYVCLRLKLSNKVEQLPLGYVRTLVESSFQGSLVFEHHHNSVVTFIRTDKLGTQWEHAICEAIRPFTEDMGMHAGLSNVVGNLMQARLYYLQADSALSNGTLFAPNCGLYRYQDWELHELILKATDDMPLDLLAPEGLRRLIEHDEHAPTSYVETLRHYLENNAAVSKTADELYVHRSTLLERLSRIRRELDIDLDDPDVQLKLRILLKAMQLRDELHRQVES